MVELLTYKQEVTGSLPAICIRLSVFVEPGRRGIPYRPHFKINTLALPRAGLFFVHSSVYKIISFRCQHMVIPLLARVNSPQ